MPRRTIVVEDEDDAVPLDDLLRTGEASRLRRRGAMRAATHRRDDEEDVPPLPPTRRIQGDESYLELRCGVRSAECSFAPAGPSRPSPLPRSPPLRKSPDVGFVFSSTGCGAVITTKASPSSASYHVYTTTESVSTDIARLPSQYLEPEQRELADAITREVCGCQCDWEAIGCRVCGNVLGFRYAGCHPRNTDTAPNYVFFASAITSSPNFTFPPSQQPEPDDLSVDSPTLSPRVTRYFRSDDEFWPSEINALWAPDPRFVPTPPRTPPSIASPLAFTAWGAVLPPPASSAQPQRQASRDIDAPTRPEPSHLAPPSESLISYNDWGSFLRSVSPRIEQPPPSQIPAEPVHLEGVPQPLPSHPVVALPQEHRDRASMERPNVSRTESMEANSRPLDPPSLHRVARRAMPPMTRRPTSLDWSNRGRHSFGPDANASWGGQGSDDRFRGIRPGRRITMPIPVPAPPPAPASALNGRTNLEAGTEEGMNVQVMVGEHDGELAVERMWNPDPDGEVEQGGEADSEEKEEDLDERRGERTTRIDNARAGPRSSSAPRLVSR